MFTPARLAVGSVAGSSVFKNHMPGSNHRPGVDHGGPQMKEAIN
jgi:hypothetical protein